VSILLVRLRLIGDVIFTTPIVRALRRHYSDARITYLVEEPAAPVVRHNPHLDEVLAVPYRRGWRRVTDDLRLARRLRRRRFDLAIDLHGGPRSAWLTWASGARRRVGYDVAGRAWMYTDAVHRPRELRPRHSVLNQWDLLAAVDEALAAGPDRARDRVEMEPGPDSRDSAARKLAGLAVPAEARIVLLHVSAGNPFRRWPAGSFAAVAAELAREDTRRRVIVTSGPSEAAAAEAVAQQARLLAGDAAAGIMRTGEFDLAELAALVGRAALYIGGDSGPLHVAATTRTPVVALFGPTLPERSMPWRDPAIGAIAVDAGPLPCRPCHQRHCVPGDFRCLTAISPTMVVAAARTLLGPPTARGR
jgi:lipopolysaccharide heptosyltransferase II